MTEAQRTALLIRKGLPRLKQGTLRLWGQWFGRPFDNVHVVTEAAATGDVLEVQFDGGESLRVVKPVGAEVDAMHFVIGDADSLRWEWNAYGRTPGRRYFEEYNRRGTVIEANTDVDWYTPDLRPSGDAVAVELV